jgi:hypothetical protein
MANSLMNLTYVHMLNKIRVYELNSKFDKTYKIFF